VCDEESLACPQANDETLMASTLVVVRQDSGHFAFTCDLETTPVGFKCARQFLVTAAERFNRSVEYVWTEAAKPRIQQKSCDDDERQFPAHVRVQAW